MKIRQLATSVWDDGYFMSLNDKERLAFFLLIHNQQLTMTGIYELPIELMTFRLRATDIEVNQIRDKFEKDGKFYFYGSWVYVANWARHNTFSSLETVIKRFAADFNKIPAAVRKYFIEVKGLKYDLPFSSVDEIALEGITVTVKGNGNGNGGIDSLSIGYGKERIDPNSIPDFDIPEYKNGAKSKNISGFAILLLTISLFWNKPALATTITNKVIVFQSVTRSSVELKSPIPKKTATSTRCEGEPLITGGVSPLSARTKPTHSPRPVVEGGVS